MVSKTPLKSRSRYTSDGGMGETIVVIAPKTLPEGYLFDVLVEGKSHTVTVPKGGVREGEEFEVPHPDAISEEITEKPTDEDNKDENEDLVSELKSVDMDNQRPYQSVKPRVEVEEEESRMPLPQVERDALGAPMGRWRYPLCACCDVLTQATFWMALCCVPVLLAQLVTRLKLNWAGRKDMAQEVSLSYNKILLTFMAALAFGNLPLVGIFVVILYMIVILVWTGRNLRNTIRKRYKIPSSCGLPEQVDDCCCMVFCCCCASIQMSRQTHNDKEYPGSCCTPTGLDLDAPEMA